MDQLIVSAFALYAVALLLPIVPAIVLFKMFPDTKVGLGGPLSGLTLNATGAFAGYLAAVLLGFFLTPEITNQISGAQATGRYLAVPIKFEDQEGHPVSAGSTSINVDFSPQLFKQGGDVMHVTFIDSRDLLPTLTFNAQGFQQQRVDLESLLHQGASTKIVVEKSDPRRLSLRDPVVLTALPRALTEPYAAAGQLPELH